MNERWKEVVKLAFKGPRFSSHALDPDALAELIQFQKMLAETAKALWRAANPGRKNLPPYFDEHILLWLRKIEPGSAVVRLEKLIEESEQTEMFDEKPSEIEQAVELAYRAFQAIERDEPLPGDFPKGLAGDYGQWGKKLGEDEAIEFSTNGERPVTVTSLTQERWTAFQQVEYDSLVDVEGEALEADVRKKRFQVWLDDNTHVDVDFGPDQEEQVTSALKNHSSIRLQVRGKGSYSAQGTLIRIAIANELRLVPVGDIPYDNTARPIEEVLMEIAAEVPQEEWDRLPSDLTDNLDRYLYGEPNE